MRRIALHRLALLGMALAIPSAASAQDGPIPPKPTSIPQPDPANPPSHRHFGGGRSIFCSICKDQKRAEAQAQQRPHVHTPPAAAPMVAGGMPAGSVIVGCAHSNNGVCATCRKLLEMPGEVTVAVPGTPVAAPGMAVAAGAPGRAVATDAAPGYAVANGAEPEPIGLMRTNYRGANLGAPAGAAQPTAAPMPSRTPFIPDQKETRPHVLGHLFGFAVMERDFKDAWGREAKMKRDAHAATAYGPEAESKVVDIPASAVYGNGVPR